MKVDIGIDMGGTRIKIGLVNDGALVATENIPASSHVTLRERLDDLADIIDQIMGKHGVTPSGIGIAFPGIVDPFRKRILSKYVKYPDAQNLDIASWADRRWGVPLALENDARAALFGEWQFGAGKGANDLVLITLGTGVGSAVLMGGKMMRGRNFLAGNLGGHHSINLDGDECNCGNTGCLESEASTWALEKIVRRSPGFESSALSRHPEINFNTLFRCAAEGDQLAIEIKERSLRAWALGIINLIVSYDPERVVIGGGIMNSKDLVIPYIREMIAKDIWIKDNAVELVPAHQLEYAGILGIHHMLFTQRT